jgi:hypothetical protein
MLLFLVFILFCNSNSSLYTEAFILNKLRDKTNIPYYYHLHYSSSLCTPAWSNWGPSGHIRPQTAVTRPAKMFVSLLLLTYLL